MRDVETTGFIPIEDSGSGIASGIVVSIDRAGCSASVVVGSGFLDEEATGPRFSGDLWSLSPEQASALGTALRQAADDASSVSCAETPEFEDELFD